MSLHRHFKPTLPASKETNLSNWEVSAAYKAIEKVTQGSQDRAEIGRYGTENGNRAAQKHFKSEFDIGESTARLFKMKYIAAVNASAGKS